MATETKPWYTSKTVWGGILTVVIGAALEIAKQFGVDLGSNAIVGAALAVLGALGVYGRVTATTSIK